MCLKVGGITLLTTKSVAENIHCNSDAASRAGGHSSYSISGLWRNASKIQIQDNSIFSVHVVFPSGRRRGRRQYAFSWRKLRPFRRLHSSVNVNIVGRVGRNYRPASHATSPQPPGIPIPPRRPIYGKTKIFGGPDGTV